MSGCKRLMCLITESRSAAQHIVNIWTGQYETCELTLADDI